MRCGLYPCKLYNYIYKSEKTFKKNAKICRDDYAKKYSNKVYIGMAVWKDRGDDINTKLNIHSPIPTSFLHVTATAALYIIWLHSSVACTEHCMLE